MAPLTCGAVEAPTDVDVRVMNLSLHGLEVLTADNVEPGEVNRSGSNAEITDVVRRRAAHTPVHATWNDGR